MSVYPGLVDSHFHSVSMRSKRLDAEACLRDFFASGGAMALDVAVDVHDWEVRQALSLAFENVYLSAGIHPSEAPRVTAEDWKLLRQQLAGEKTVAVGEIGLDWYRGRDHEAAQRELFRSQLRLASEVGKPIIIHNREADRELLADLDAEQWSGQGIFHCFSSDLAMARAGLDRGFYISFAGNVTYPSAENLRAVARYVPRDRLLVETDSPYLSPQARRGQPNQPLFAGLTAQVLSEVRNQPVAELLSDTGENFRRLFLL